MRSILNRKSGFLCEVYLINRRNRSKKVIIPVGGQDREAMLFGNILKTRNVAIGPLEYCGNGRIVRTSHGEKM